MHGFHAVSVDLRGHGDSGWSPDGDYRLDRYADDLDDVLHHLGRPAALVGASLGGLTSLLVAGEQRPAAVWALVLVDVVPQIEAEGAQAILGFMTASPDGFASVTEAADAVAAYLPHRPRRSDPSGLMKNLRQGSDGRFRWHWDPAMMSGNRPADPAGWRRRLDSAAASVVVPTLVIRGGLSRVVSPEGVAALRRQMPHAEFVQVQDADHMVAGDANDGFDRPLLEFLARARSSLDKGATPD